MKIKLCSVENCNYPSWSKGFCKNHTPKKQPKSFEEINEKNKEKKELKTKKTKILHQFFLDLWDERADKNGNIKCFETEILMSGSIYKNNICCYSHQLSKSKYPEYALEKENILIVLPDVHANWESNQELCPKMLVYTKKLKKKYEIN